MAQINTWFKQDLNDPIRTRTIPNTLYMEDNLGNRFGVEVNENGVSVELEGECSYQVLLSNGATVIGEGYVDGNKMYADLPFEAYSSPGRTVVFLRHKKDGVMLILLAVAFIVEKTRDNVIIDPSKIIPSIDVLLEKIEEMIEGTEAANAAAELANEKAELADTKAALAQQSADRANQATQAANNATEAAISAANLANQKAGLANDAASLANTKAALAQEKADLADSKAGLANSAAENANTKAGLANAAAENANSKAALANEKAALADEKATLANEKAALADEKANLANEKAGLANTAAGNADNKAALAQEKANLADQKATLANEKAALANTKAEKADQSADRANAAALLIDALTVAAQTLQPGTPVTADLSVVDGHYHISFGITKGDKGDQAEMLTMTFQYQQSSNGSEIPTGQWSDERPEPRQGEYIWVKVHKTWNNGTQTDEYNVGGRNGVDGEGSVKSVEGISPDGSGNVTLNLQNRFYTKQQTYQKSETYSKEEVEQKIEDMNFFTVNEDGALCQRYDEPSNSEE